MEHLGHNRTLQLIRHRFYWPKIEDDVRHFVSKVCSCVKSKKPHRGPVAQVQSISSSALSELTGLLGAANIFWYSQITSSTLYKRMQPP